MLVFARSYVIVCKKLCYCLQEVMLVFARSYVLFIFTPKMRNPTASLFRGLQPPIPHARACE
ncbi:hypothetical protein D2C84_08145 (plasmid) [Helicobacter pylori]|nr:hypothetical protein D2C86_08115 [Helicobacter pylori]QEF26177.1 hypothetical protein D2C84_08125 [Helicobacter pylori]QEF26180.1 hypothetical protein D2C84_08145 [Helicobacter pylori]